MISVLLETLGIDKEAVLSMVALHVLTMISVLITHCWYREELGRPEWHSILHIHAPYSAGNICCWFILQSG